AGGRPPAPRPPGPSRPARPRPGRPPAPTAGARRRAIGRAGAAGRASGSC
ncbi:MAG: RNA helicase, partial [Planctomycetes bacterium]|nr:RNA helicase [Planctomycetota bacterium]